MWHNLIIEIEQTEKLIREKQTLLEGLYERKAELTGLCPNNFFDEVSEAPATKGSSGPTRGEEVSVAVEPTPEAAPIPEVSVNPNQWYHIGGKLKHISVSHECSKIWGTNHNDDIYFRNGKDGNWQHIAGKLI